MRERNVRISDVKMAILEPEHQESILSSKFLAARRFNSKILEVVYFKKGSVFIIITAYWL